jgi:hypothetical protein
VMGCGLGFCGPNIFAFAQTLPGAAAADKWTGMQNCLGNVFTTPKRIGLKSN